MDCPASFEGDGNIPEEEKWAFIKRAAKLMVLGYLSNETIPALGNNISAFDLLLLCKYGKDASTQDLAYLAVMVIDECKRIKNSEKVPTVESLDCSEQDEEIYVRSMALLCASGFIDCFVSYNDKYFSTLDQILIFDFGPGNMPRIESVKEEILDLRNQYAGGRAIPAESMNCFGFH